MKKLITFLLTFVFLLFVVENRGFLNLVNQQDFGTVSNTITSKNHSKLNQNLEKRISQNHQDSDSISEEMNDDEFQISTVLHTILVVAEVLGIALLVPWLFWKRIKIHFEDSTPQIFSTRKFIVLRSIRI